MDKTISEQALKDMKQELRQLAKTANQRMERLEKVKDSKNRAEHIKELKESNLTYSTTQVFLQNQKVKGKRIDSERFVETISTMDKMTEADIQAQINRARAFLNAKSSTKRGQKQIEKNRTIGLQEKIKSMEVNGVKLDKNISYKKAKTIGDFFGELERTGHYHKKGKSDLDSEEVIQKYYEIEQSDFELSPEEAIKNVKTYEDAVKMNSIFNMEIFDLSQFEDDEGEDD